MQVVGGESLQLPTATAGAWQQATYNTSLSGRAGAAGCGSGCEQGESRHGMAGEIGQRNNLLEGYQLEYSEVDVVLHYDLPDSRQWKKRVWPRKSYPKKLFRWNTTEEILSYLISFEDHNEWISTNVPQKPPSGSILFFHRKQTKRYRIDGYEWKTRRTTNTVREDRMKLKVGGYQLLYGCYAHSASNPNFHRRSYWLIQNPDLIMVHYLELDCSDGIGPRTSSPDPAARQNSVFDLEQSIEPSAWSLLTISDCNLCALLSMVQTSESTKALLTQLTSVLNQNVQRASSLEEVIEMSNKGLPEDMFKDTRSRKMKFGGTNSTIAVSGGSGSGGNSNKKDMEPLLQAAMSNLHSDGQGAGGESSSRMVVDCSSTSSTNGTVPGSTSISIVPTPTSTVISTPTSSISTAASMSLDSTQKALNVLSKSAHIIVCCQKPGSLSYILTVPTSSTNSTASTPVPTPGRRILPSPGNGVESSNSCSIINKLSGLIRRTSEKCGKGSSKNAVLNSSQGESSKVPSSMSEAVKDYDAEKFSKFANILVNMDGIEGLQTTESSTSEDAPNNHYNQQQLQQLQQSRLQLLTSSSSDVEFTDSLESENSVTQQVECVEDSHEEVMDFASIVSSAVGSNSDQRLGKNGDHTSVLPLLPEVPMSWLKVIPTSTELNGHHERSDSMEATQTAEGLCTSTQANSSGAPPTTMTTGSVTTTDVMTDVRIIDQPLPSSSDSNSTTATTDIPPGPPPQLNLTTDGKNHSTKDHQSVIGTQVHAHVVIDQPMAVSEHHNNGGAGDDFLDVSLDLDAESLQQLLTLSHSPESHRSSTYQQQPSSLHPTMSTDAAPLSPISQLFDKLEPASITSPGAQIDLSDAQLLPNNIHEQRRDNSSENPNHFHTDFNNHTHLNNLSSQQSGANHKNQSVTLYNPSNDNSTQVGVPGRGSTGDVAGSSMWTPSPNSLQLWLESTSGGFGDNILPSTSSESTTTIVAPSHHQPQAMDIDDNSELTSVDLPQDLCEFLTQSSELPHQSNTTENSSIQMQYSHPIHLHMHNSDSSFEGRDGFHSSSSNISEHDYSLAHQSDPNHGALYDSTEHFPGPFDVFCAHPDPSIGSYQNGTSPHTQVQRKSSNTSISSEPLPFDSLRVPPTMYGASESSHHCLSLPNLANLDTNDQGSSSLEPSQGGSPIHCGSGGFTSSPCSHRSISPNVALPDIPEGVQIRSPMTQFDPSQFNMDLLQYRTSSPVPSSPSIASVSSKSTVSTHELFENESPSVLELCEMLSESPNVRHQDFSHMVLSESEQQQLFRSAQVIQNAFRSYKSRRQTHDKEKSAALLIENCYKNYVQMKREKDRAARRIQQQYRIYKTRTKELNRAAVFIQQMYRYQKHRRVPDSSAASVSTSSQLISTPPPSSDPS